VACWVEGTPLHYQVRERMLNRILRGEWPPGLAIPSESVLVSEYDVSRPTIRQAIQALRTEGYLVARKGAGTFVRKRLLEAPLVLTAPSVTALGGDDFAWSRREVRREVRPVGESEAELGLAVGTPVLMVEQVTSRDDVPFCLVYSFHVRFTETTYEPLVDAHPADMIRVSGNVLIPYEADLLEESSYTASLLIEIRRHDADGRVAQLHRVYVPGPAIVVELADGLGNVASVLGLLDIGT